MAIKETSAMIAGMAPELQPGTWVFCFTKDVSIVAATSQDALAIIRESEGVTLVLPEKTARQNGFDAALCLKQITLKVFSDLEGVGLTAAVAKALTEANIPCNVIAAFHHDHVLVPAGQADRAMAALIALQRSHQIQ